MKPIGVLAAAFFAAACTFAGGVVADEDPTYTGPLSPAETQFLQSVRRDLLARFPRVGDGERAGYFRYNDPDDTGAISYANKQWNSDPTHPSQLWYDAQGNLMGADFSVVRTHNEPRPHLWGINPGRWYEFNGHIHYVIANPATGHTIYNQWIWDREFAEEGGSLEHPSADTLVKLNKVPNARYVATIFNFPTQWDLIVWMKPHQPTPFSW
ncbi:MAG: hypothetical protein JO078_11685 [Candidatus Eremiobacteraeota bacterium]|nr:hypothetical protein [Candidatus Eremiobacteraeota bacterium]